MGEIIPIAFGACGGLAVGRLTARFGVWPWVVLAVGLGFAATVLTGEWKISWAYLLVDIPLVAFSSLVTYTATRHWSRSAQRLDPT